MLKSKINSYFVKHDKSRITLGDVLQNFKFNVVQTNGDVKEFSYEYLIVITQDCDLEQWENNRKTPPNTLKNQFLANILILPAFLAERIRRGDAYKELFNIQQESKGSDEFKKITQNKNERYHFLKSEDDIQDLIIDFKHYFTIPYDTLKEQYEEKYLATVNELFRENLSSRFTNYLSRIGLPDIS